MTQDPACYFSYRSSTFVLIYFYFQCREAKFCNRLNQITATLITCFSVHCLILDKVQLFPWSIYYWPSLIRKEEKKEKKNACSYIYHLTWFYFYWCPRSSDPIFIVNYYVNGSLLLGHTVWRESRFYFEGFATYSISHYTHFTTSFLN